MREIILNTGEVAFVNNRDFNKVSIYKWYVINKKHTKYAQCYLGNYKWVSMHRFIMGVTGSKIHIDHKDKNGLNNQRSNLRVCSSSDNHRNVRPKGSSKYVGVHLHMDRYWVAKINIAGKQKHLGSFKNEKDAAIAYNRAAIKSRNKFFNLNKI